ncbi:hypothetical protein GCM10028794_04050 [Silanimonas algicola]
MPRSEAQAREQGFILAMVLWMLVAIAVGVGFLMLWTRERVAEATLDRAEVEDRIAALSTRETLLYLAATVPITQAGQPLTPMPEGELAARRLDDFGGFDKRPRGGELRLDGRAYRGLGGITFAIQDESGLVPVAFPETSPVPRLLAAAGAPARDVPGLVDRLVDYTDPDDLKRLNGAESRDYERAGRPAPPGRPLLSPRELPRVLGWEALPPEVMARAQDWSTSAYAGALNLNTAPLPLLEAFVDRCGTVCRARLARRDEALFFSGRQFEEETSARLLGDRDTDFRNAPSDAWRLAFWGASGRAWRIHVRLTPLADQAAPWTVDAVYRAPRPDADDAPPTIPSPLFADAPLDRG